MYRALVARRTREAFAALSRGEWQPLVKDMRDDVHHVFPGDHPLGGERRSREAVARWFERLVRLFPGHEFTVHRVHVRGGPANTWVAAQWTAQMTPQRGQAYPNDGTHWINLRWGKVAGFHAYLDTQRIAEACRAMAAAGVEEAAAPPVTG